MKIANNNENQEEYKAFLKNIRAEKEESSNFTKLLFTVVLAVLCAVIVCVTVVENSYILDKISTEQADNASGFFKFYKKKRILKPRFLQEDRTFFCSALIPTEKVLISGKEHVQIQLL